MGMEKCPGKRRGREDERVPRNGEIWPETVRNGAADERAVACTKAARDGGFSGLHGRAFRGASCAFSTPRSALLLGPCLLRQRSPRVREDYGRLKGFTGLHRSHRYMARSERILGRPAPCRDLDNTPSDYAGGMTMPSPVRRIMSLLLVGFAVCWQGTNASGQSSGWVDHAV